MSNKFFGQFLLEKGLLDKTQLLTAIDLQKTLNPTIGQIAIEEGFLTEANASKINAEQQRTDERFGDLSISMGYMTEKQIDQLFQIQKNGRKFFGEILVDQGFLSEKTITEELAKHAKEKQQITIQVNDTIADHPHSKLILNTLDIVVKMFLRVAKIQLQVSDITNIKEDIKSNQIACSQTMYLPEPLKLGWIMEDNLMISIANTFLDMDVSDQPLVFKDATSEFLNIILGNILANRKEQQTRLDPPQISEAGEDFQTPFQRHFQIKMSTPDQDFILFLLYN